MNIDWKYPLLFGCDLKSLYKSVWIGWWLITWTTDDGYSRPHEINISFQPGL